MRKGEGEDGEGGGKPERQSQGEPQSAISGAKRWKSEQEGAGGGTGEQGGREGRGREGMERRGGKAKGTVGPWDR